MEIKINNEEEKKKNKNKNKVLVCGLASGLVTKTLFAPFDRVKLFYQIQPMFHHYSKEKNKCDLKVKKKKYVISSKNLLLKNLDKKENKQTSVTTKLDLKPKKYVQSENVVFRNFKNSLKQIIQNSTKKKKRKKSMNKNIKYSDLCIHYNKSKYSSSHETFKKILCTYQRNKTNVNNLSKNYTLLSTNNNIRHVLTRKGMFLSKANNSINQPLKYQSITQSFLFIIKEEGVLGLWKGNLINTLRGGIVYSAKFGTNDLIKDKYKKKKKEENTSVQLITKGITNKDDKNYKDDKDGKNANNQLNREKKNFNYYESVIAGYASGIIQKTLSYPLDLLSIRVALGINEKYLRNNNSVLYKKKSIFNIIREINNNEGITGFFKGYLPTLLTGVPYVTLQMLFFDYYKNIFQNYFPHKSNSISSVAIYSSVAGSLSNLSSLIIVFPGDTVRKRMMNNGIDNKNYIYKNTIHCIKNIYYYEGVRNFYYGLFPSMLKSIPSGAIQFMSYEILKHMLSHE
ncbi:mitochondrial carrier protein [Plasmodium gonderi]|uniref:Mitochondrial carrier protein n=1 Tax=Plasmodium gonderi TaxID=77519 RepID=A0A1Y1JGC2_PLAGO|nr:mitochondrial carrier protein [Plasmodium gonderi]GAW81571.1 mitochondrial carrier protein [Plasmodium gonderi]